PVRPRPVVLEQGFEVGNRSRLCAPNPGALVASGARHHAPTLRAPKALRSTLELRDREPSRSRRPQHCELIGDLQLARTEAEDGPRTAARRARRPPAAGLFEHLAPEQDSLEIRR